MQMEQSFGGFPSLILGDFDPMMIFPKLQFHYQHLIAVDDHPSRRELVKDRPSLSQVVLLD